MRCIVLRGDFLSSRVGILTANKPWGALSQGMWTNFPFYLILHFCNPINCINIILKRTNILQKCILTFSSVDLCGLLKEIKYDYFRLYYIHFLHNKSWELSLPPSKDSEQKTKVSYLFLSKKKTGNRTA